MQTEQGKIPPPPGLIAAIASGFDAVATHILVIALPLLLDLFLWLGPHLSLVQLAQPIMDQLPPIPASPLTQTLNPASTGASQLTWATFLDRFNLFNLMQTFPVGVSSLVGGGLLPLLPAQTPLGGPVKFEVNSILTVVGMWILLVLLGWMLGGLYYHWVSRISLKLGPRPLRESLKQIILLSIIWVVLTLIVGFPVLLVLAILNTFIPLLGWIAQFVIVMFAIWLLMPVFFSPHGIFAYQQDAFHSILNSLRMVRFTLPNTGLFLLAFVLIGQGLNLLWRTPPDDSWLMLVGIAGHAFVSTALLAASFIYYRDINAWLKTVFDILKAQASSARI